MSKATVDACEECLGMKEELVPPGAVATSGAPTGGRPAPERPTSELPRIYAFSNVVGGGDGIAYAMAEDGTVLGSHWCSHEGYVSHDLGVREGTRPDRHETYRAHYPDGYQMEFIPAAQVATHPGLSRAWNLNQEQGRAAKAAAALGNAEVTGSGQGPREATPDVRDEVPGRNT